jgi:hypothetical protein
VAALNHLHVNQPNRSPQPKRNLLLVSSSKLIPICACRVGPCADYKISIDKLSLVCTDPDDDQVNGTYDRIGQVVNSRRLLGVFVLPGKRYRHQVNIPFPETGQRVLFQFGPKGSKCPAYRTELNPALLGKSGVERLIDLFDELLPQGGIKFIRHSTVTRIDIALDVIGYSANDAIVRSRKQQIHGVFSDRNGNPATHYFGRPKNNNTAVYTKPDPDGHHHLRIERRLKPRCRAIDLPFIKNPFNCIQIVHTDALLPHIDGLNPEHFFDSIRVRGFTHVLKNLPTAQRKALTAVLKDPTNSLLPAMDEVWGHWPEVLASSGLGFLLEPEASASTSSEQLTSAAE